MWVPVQFELDVRGVQEIVLGRRRFVSWSSVASYQVDPQGVVLLGSRFPDPLSLLRGLYIAAGDRHEELVALVQFYEDQARIEERSEVVA